MIIFICGPDTFRGRKKLNEIKEKFRKEVDFSGSSLVTINGSETNIEEISRLITPSSLFARKRLIVIENIFSLKKQEIFFQILEYFKKRFFKNKETKEDNDNIIVFFDEISPEDKKTKYQKELFNFLFNGKFVFYFKTLSNTEIINFIKKEMEKNNIKIEKEALSLLISVLGNDMWQIYSEIEKLVHYKLAQKINLNLKTNIIINIEDIKKMTRGRLDDNIFALTDAIGRKDKISALRFIEKEIEAGVTDVYLLSMIIRQFKILLQIKEALDNGASSRRLAQELKLHPFIIQKGIVQAKNFSFEKIKNIFNSLVNLDYQFKAGKSDIKTSLSLLIVKM